MSQETGTSAPWGLDIAKLVTANSLCTIQSQIFTGQWKSFDGILHAVLRELANSGSQRDPVLVNRRLICQTYEVSRLLALAPGDLQLAEATFPGSGEEGLLMQQRCTEVHTQDGYLPKSWKKISFEPESLPRFGFVTAEPECLCNTIYKVSRNRIQEAKKEISSEVLCATVLA